MAVVRGPKKRRHGRMRGFDLRQDIYIYRYYVLEDVGRDRILNVCARPIWIPIIYTIFDCMLWSALAYAPVDLWSEI